MEELSLPLICSEVTWVWRQCHFPSLSSSSVVKRASPVAFRRIGHAPCLSNTVELALKAEAQVSSPRVREWQSWPVPLKMQVQHSGEWTQHLDWVELDLQALVREKQGIPRAS